MKKIYPIIALFITILGSIINVITYKISDTILLGISIHGGEITQKIGFGIICDTYYPLTNDPNMEALEQSITPSNIKCSLPTIFPFLTKNICTQASSCALAIAITS